MRLWIVSVGEPLPVDGDNVRLRRMGNLAMYASSNNVDVEWFSVSFDHYGKTQRCETNKDYQINDNFTMHLVYTNGYKRNVSLARIIHHKNAGKNIKKRMGELNKPDIIFASMEPLEVSNAAVKYAEENNVPCIVDVRDLWPEIYYDVIPKQLHFILDIYVKSCTKSLSYTMEHSDSIVGLSEGFLNYGLKYAKRKRSENDRIFPIAYPNYNYNEYKGRLEELWGQYGICQDDFIVTFLGNFGDQFKFEEIIEAAKKLEKYNIKFVLCGNGKHIEEIKAQVSSNVIIPGWIEKAQILSLLSNSKVGIAPYINSMNYRMNTPNKFGEYLSASLPIAVSVSGEMEKLLKQNECGYMYTDGSSLANIILEYYKSTEKQTTHAKNARKLYEKMFNADFANDNLLKHINNVAISGRK